MSRVARRRVLSRIDSSGFRIKGFGFRIKG